MYYSSAATEVQSLQFFVKPNMHTVSANGCFLLVYTYAVIFMSCSVQSRLFVNYTSEVQKNQSSQYTLNDLLSGDFVPFGWNGSWTADEQIIYKLHDNKDIAIFDLKRNASRILIGAEQLKNYSHATVSLSADGLYALIRYNASSVFRHSSTALYAIHDFRLNKTYDLAERKPIQLAVWAPVGHRLAYVESNDIYLYDITQNKISRITNTGIPDIVYNGVPDWVYEEEVLASAQALWWSHDGNSLAFAQFDDTNVYNFSYAIYGSELYPHIRTIRYPKVGTENPKVLIFVARGGYEPVAIPMEFQPLSSRVFYGFCWIVNSDRMAFMITNRVQNEGQLVTCSWRGPKADDDFACIKEATYRATNGWLKMRLPYFLGSNGDRAEIMPQREDNGELFEHLVAVYDGMENRRLTQGDFVVTKVHMWDAERQLLYFEGTGINAPSQQHLYSVRISNKTNTELRCLTCGWLAAGQLCKYVQASFSPKGSYWSLSCLGPAPCQVQLHSKQGLVRDWINNEKVLTRLHSKVQPDIENLEVPVTKTQKARVRLFLPPQLDRTKKHPAIVEVYAGPGSNKIADAFGVGWPQYATCTRRFVYILIDGRGSGRTSLNYTFEIYGKFAGPEIDDQLAVVRYLHNNEKYSFIDRNRTAIWGWSYGGFAATWALAKDRLGTFKFALAVAPVTNFWLYDTIYTERYMGLLGENFAGYRATDLSINVTDKFKGKHLFIIHGNADDNVHYQSSMRLVRALERSDLPFRLQSYPDEAHSLIGVRSHLYKTMDAYWTEMFK